MEARKNQLIRQRNSWVRLKLNQQRQNFGRAFLRAKKDLSKRESRESARTDVSKIRYN
ncbi:hypothetical protein CDL15_Pgr000071 [Punica granatum]|uniref:Uncharacterized protein n=1 Tax=Punica granatum TaxID=22663 RepID=A0A218VQD8_PUNGR|nr:hypothetical protein CDL15_Pgr000071 [Punica granatum]